MCDSFWCRGCQQHKKVSARSLKHKIGGALCCVACEENMARLFTPKGDQARAKRIADANNRPAHFMRRVEDHCSTL